MDNFNMKQWLQNNKTGVYSNRRLNEDIRGEDPNATADSAYENFESSVENALRYEFRSKDELKNFYKTHQDLIDGYTEKEYEPNMDVYEGGEAVDRAVANILQAAKESEGEYDDMEQRHDIEQGFQSGEYSALEEAQIDKTMQLITVLFDDNDVAKDDVLEMLADALQYAPEEFIDGLISKSTKAGPYDDLDDDGQPLSETVGWAAKVKPTVSQKKMKTENGEFGDDDDDDLNGPGRWTPAMHGYESDEDEFSGKMLGRTAGKVRGAAGAEIGKPDLSYMRKLDKPDTRYPLKKDDMPLDKYLAQKEKFKASQQFKNSGL